MKASTEEFLLFLLWTADTLLRPTWRNMNDGFEAWAWRSHLGRRLAELQQQKLIERAPALPGSLPHALVRLTNAGRLAALGGRDPDAQWNRPWDGQWRAVLFDVPLRQHHLHVRLWRNLRNQGFGFLQNSVWITPDPINRERLQHQAELPSVEMIIVLQGRPCTGESDAAIVRGAWDFEEINRRYDHCLRLLQAGPRAPAPLAAVREWSRTERAAWNAAVRLDPFLPAALQPADYLGRRTWNRRKHRLAELAGSLAIGGPAPDRTL